MKSLESGVIWGQRRSGGVRESLSSGDNLLLPTWTLSLAVGANGDLVLQGAPKPVSGPSRGLAIPRKLGALKCKTWEWGGVRECMAPRADSHPPADQRVPETDPAFPEPR